MVEKEAPSLASVLASALASAWSHFRWVVGLRDPSELTVEDFRLELAELGLLGRAFGLEQYRAALEEYLGVEISVEELPDAEGGALAGELAAEGNMAEVVYDDLTGKALVLVRESLRYRPWPAYELAVFHELSHLAAGHPLRVRRARGKGTGNKFSALGAGRLARREPLVLSSNEERSFEELKSEVLEPEARKRAKWLMLAGTCPEAFEADKADRLT